MVLRLADRQMVSLRDFAPQLLEHLGALVEQSDGVVDALLPESLEGELGGGGFLRLAFDRETAERSGAEYLAVGSPTAERLLSLAGGIGATTRWFVNGLKWSKHHSIDLDRWKAKLVNARATYEGIEFPFACHYLLFNFLVSYLSDEKREEVRSVVVDAGTLQPAPKLQEGWLHMSLQPKRDFYVGDVDTLPQATQLAVVYRRATQLLQHQIAGNIATYRRRTARHLEMEHLRIETFYDDTRAELIRRRDRTEDPERRITLERKIEACDREREAKLADVAAKHRVRVVVRPLNAAVITQPKVRARLKVENRYATATVDVIFDPLVGELELPSCGVCHEGATALHLCANGHLACDACTRACGACKREQCLACGMAACTICGLALCDHSQNRCLACGSITCREHHCACGTRGRLC